MWGMDEPLPCGACRALTSSAHLSGDIMPLLLGPKPWLLFSVCMSCILPRGSITSFSGNCWCWWCPFCPWPGALFSSTAALFSSPAAHGSVGDFVYERKERHVCVCVFGCGWKWYGSSVAFGRVRWCWVFSGGGGGWIGLDHICNPCRCWVDVYSSVQFSVCFVVQCACLIKILVRLVWSEIALKVCAQMQRASAKAWMDSIIDSYFVKRFTLIGCTVCNREITLIRLVLLDTFDYSRVNKKIARVCIHFLCCVEHKEIAAILLNIIAKNVICSLNLNFVVVNVDIVKIGKIVPSICRNKESNGEQVNEQ